MLHDAYKLGAEKALETFGVHGTPKPPPTWSQGVQKSPRKTVQLGVTIPSMSESPAR
jgi:hypothetical protein